MSQEKAKLPPPPVAAFVDLRKLPFMMVDVQRLLNCDRQTECTAESNWVALTLWCKAWHLMPAGSLPNDDIKLSAFAGYGRAVGEWLKIKESALRGFTLYADGRLHHSYLSVAVNKVWQDHLKHRYKLLSDRLRVAKLPVPSREEWSAEGYPDSWSVDSASPTADPSSSGSPRKSKKSLRTFGNSERNLGDSERETESSDGILGENPLKVKEGNVNKDSLSNTHGGEREFGQDEEFNKVRQQLIDAGWRGNDEQARALFEAYSKCPAGSLEDALTKAKVLCNLWPNGTSWLMTNASRVQIHPGREAGEAVAEAEAKRLRAEQAREAQVQASARLRICLDRLAEAVMTLPAEQFHNLKKRFESDRSSNKTFGDWRLDKSRLWPVVHEFLHRTDPILLAQLAGEELGASNVIQLPAPTTTQIGETVNHEALAKLTPLVAGG
jgi:hypothetical protein